MTELSALKRQVQQALVDRGYELGNTGPAGNGVDGADGLLTWQAIAAALAETSNSPPAPTSTGALRFITLDLLKCAAPHLSDLILAPWVEPIRKACERYEINTIRRIAAFVTTLAHEGRFKVGARENMNYSAKRLTEVWPNRFSGTGHKGGPPNALAKALDRKPELIANHVYANRMGNGPPESGDGWLMRGNGPIQLTGRDNHRAFAKAYGLPLPDAIKWIGTYEGGVESSAWFWEENDVNRLADTPGVADETRRINGGAVGLKAREKIFNALVAYMLKKERET